MADSTLTRDSKGQFAAGNAGGPGRPPAAKEEHYLELLRQTVDLSQWQTAIRAVLRKAQEGDLRAFEALAKYIMPLPAQRLKISDEPQKEFRVAGMSPGELGESMVNRLIQKVLERQAYEKMVEADRVKAIAPTISNPASGAASV